MNPMLGTLHTESLRCSVVSFAKFTHDSILLICLTKSLHGIKMLALRDIEREHFDAVAAVFVPQRLRISERIWIFDVTWGFKPKN